MKQLGIKNNFKHFVRFLIGISCVFFITTAFEISPIATNAIIYIKTIFLTTSGSNASATGIILEWSGGNARFKGSMTIDSLPNIVVLGTNGSGKLLASTSGAVYNFISGFVFGGITWTQGNTWTIGATWTQGIQWNTWATGVTWIQGIQWNTWATGTMGATWLQWNTWLQWVTGATGTTWSQWIKGNTWAIGATGATGFLQAGSIWAMPYWNGSAWITTSTNIFNTWWNIGIGLTNPLATLDVFWTMRILSSMTGRKYSNTHSPLWYFPQWVITGSLNTWLQWDSIWYVWCSTKLEILLIGFTWSNIALADTWFSNTYFVSPIGGMAQLWNFTYHLKAWETFWVVLNSCSTLLIYKQEYGKQLSPMFGDPITLSDYNLTSYSNSLTGIFP